MVNMPLTVIVLQVVCSSVCVISCIPQPCVISYIPQPTLCCGHKVMVWRGGQGVGEVKHCMWYKVECHRSQADVKDKKEYLTSKQGKTLRYAD